MPALPRNNYALPAGLRLTRAFVAVHDDYDDLTTDCANCGGEGFTYGCSWDWQCDTYDERRIVGWLRSLHWTNLHRLAATSFADAIESLAHRKAEDADR